MTKMSEREDYQESNTISSGDDESDDSITDTAEEKENANTSTGVRLLIKRLIIALVSIGTAVLLVAYVASKEFRVDERGKEISLKYSIKSLK